MVNLQSQNIEVSKERRLHPRLEFHCTVLFDHLKGVLNVTNLSLSGVFIGIEDKSGLELEQHVRLAIKFPTEEKALLLNAKIVNVNKRGVGCQFVDLTAKHIETIKSCFETFRDTLPLR